MQLKLSTSQNNCTQMWPAKINNIKYCKFSLNKHQKKMKVVMVGKSPNRKLKIIHKILTMNKN